MIGTSGSLASETRNGIVSSRPRTVLLRGSTTSVGRESSAGRITKPLTRTVVFVASQWPFRLTMQSSLRASR